MGGRLARLTLVALIGSLVLSMPVGSSAAGGDARRPEGTLATARARVKIVDNAFRPKTITVARGARVRWVNRGSTVHSVKPAKGKWGSDLLAPGERYGHVFRRAGTYTYYCTVHPTMRGTIVVT